MAKSALMGNVWGRAAYKTAGSAAAGMGLEPRAASEAALSALLATAAAKRAAGLGDRKAQQKGVVGAAVRAAWDMYGVLNSPENRSHLERMGIDPRHIDRVMSDYVASQADRAAKPGRVMAPPNELAEAYADGAARVPPIEPSSHTAPAILAAIKAHAKLSRAESIAAD